MSYSRAPSLGMVLYLLKNSAADFFRFHQSHRQSLGKLQSLDQLPPEELKEVMTALLHKFNLSHRQIPAAHTEKAVYASLSASTCFVHPEF